MRSQQFWCWSFTGPRGIAAANLEILGSDAEVIKFVLSNHVPGVTNGLSDCAAVVDKRTESSEFSAATSGEWLLGAVGSIIHEVANLEVSENGNIANVGVPILAKGVMDQTVGV